MKTREEMKIRLTEQAKQNEQEQQKIKDLLRLQQPSEDYELYIHKINIEAILGAEGEFDAYLDYQPYNHNQDNENIYIRKLLRKDLIIVKKTHEHIEEI